MLLTTYYSLLTAPCLLLTTCEWLPSTCYLLLLVGWNRRQPGALTNLHTLLAETPTHPRAVCAVSTCRYVKQTGLSKVSIVNGPSRRGGGAVSPYWLYPEPESEPCRVGARQQALGSMHRSSSLAGSIGRSRRSRSGTKERPPSIRSLAAARCAACGFEVGVQHVGCEVGVHPVQVETVDALPPTSYCFTDCLLFPAYSILITTYSLLLTTDCFTCYLLFPAYCFLLTFLLTAYCVLLTADRPAYCLR